MFTRISFLITLALALLAALPVTTNARPKHATFEQVIDRSATIAIAKFTGALPDTKKYTVQVEVLQVLKGKLKPGVQHLQFSDRPKVGNKREEFIAFLDDADIWEFVASPIKELRGNLAKGVSSLPKLWH